MAIAVYPNEIDNIPIAVNNITPINADIVNCYRSSIIAVEEELGIDPSATFGTVRARLDDMDERIAQGGGANTGRTKVSSTDTAFGFLDTKIIGGANVTVSVQNLGGDEFLEISSSGGSSTGEIKISLDDTTLGFAETKFVAGTNVTLTVLNPGGNETLEISSSGGGVSDLASVLGVGDLTGGNNIVMEGVSSLTTDGDSTDLLLTTPGGVDAADIFLAPGVGSSSDGRVFIDASVTATSGTLEIGTNTKIDGDLEVTGVIDPIGLILLDQASRPLTPTAVQGLLWTSSATSPNKLFFTDNTGADIELGSTPATPTLAQVLVSGNLTGAQEIEIESGSKLISSPGTISTLPVDLEIRAGAAFATSGDPGAFARLVGGNGDGVGVGGDGTVSGGTSVGGIGGPARLFGGTGITGGGVEATAGSGTTGGSAVFRAGSGTVTGGDTQLSGGNNAGGAGGDTFITGGTGSTEDGYIYLNSRINSSTNLIDIRNNVRIAGDLEVTGVIDPEGLILVDQASRPVTPTGVQGLLWTSSATSPNKLFFTDNTGADIELGGTPVADTLADVLVQGNVTGPTNIEVESKIVSSDGTISVVPVDFEIEAGSAFVGTDDTGAFIRIQGGQGDGTGDGGVGAVLGGNAAGTGTGGEARVRGGDGDVGGPVQIRGGTGTSVNGLISLDSSITSSLTEVEFVKDVRIDGDLEVTGIIDPLGLILVEQAVAPTVPGATNALLWAETGALTNSLMYSDNGAGETNVTSNLLPDRSVVDQALVTQPFGIESPFSFAFEDSGNALDAWVVDGGQGFSFADGYDGYEVSGTGPLQLGAVLATAGFTRVDDVTHEVLEVLDAADPNTLLFDAVGLNGVIWGVGETPSGGHLFAVTPGAPSTIFFDGPIPSASGLFFFTSIIGSASYLYTADEFGSAFRIDPTDVVGGTTLFTIGSGNVDETRGLAFDPINNRVWIGTTSISGLPVLYAYTGDTTTEVDTFSGAELQDLRSLSFGAGALWVAGTDNLSNPAVIKVNSIDGTFADSVDLSSVMDIGLGTTYDEVNAKVWANGYSFTSNSFVAVRIDPTFPMSIDSTPVILGDAPGYIKASEGKIWGIASESEVVVIDPVPATPTTTLIGPRTDAVWLDIPDMEGYGLVKADFFDTVPNSLNTKILAGTNVSTSVVSDFGTQKLRIDASAPAGDDNKVAVNAADAFNANFLENKIEAGTGVTLAISGTPAVEINVPATLDIGKVQVDATDSLDYLETQIVAGAGLAIDKTTVVTDSTLNVRIDSFGNGLENGAGRRAAVDQYAILAPKELEVVAISTYTSGEEFVGMTFDGELIWTVQRDGGAGSDGVVRSYPFMGPFGVGNDINTINVNADGFRFPVAVGWDGEYIWVLTEGLDPFGSETNVLRYDITGSSHVLVDSTTTPEVPVSSFGQEPTEFIWDGQSMVLNMHRAIQKFDPSDMSSVTLGSLAEDNNFPIFDGSRYWVLEDFTSGDDSLKEFDLGALGVAPTVVDTHIIGETVSKMTYDGANLWILSATQGRVIRFNVLTRVFEVIDYSSELPPTAFFANVRFDGEVIWVHGFVSGGDPFLRFIDPQSGRLIGGPVDITVGTAGTVVWSPEVGILIVAGGLTSPVPTLGAFSRKRPGLSVSQARLNGARSLAGVSDDLDITGLPSMSLMPADFLSKKVIPIIGSGTLTLGFTEDGYSDFSSGPYVINNLTSSGTLSVSDHTFTSTLVIPAGPHSFYIDKAGVPILLY